MHRTAAGGVPVFRGSAGRNPVNTVVMPGILTHILFDARLVETLIDVQRGTIESLHSGY